MNNVPYAEGGGTLVRVVVPTTARL
jgi:hypothetical protein